MIDVDNTAKEILDRNYKVVPKSKHSNLLPYTDYSGEHSPLTDFIYYQKMPEVYRTFDTPLGKPLYRYLQALIEGGYAELIYNSTKGNRGIDNLLELIDPQTCPEEFLPIYCKSLGIEWFQDLIVEREGIDSYYFIRTFLSNVGEIYKRRGTESVIKYIAKTLTSMDVKLSYRRIMSGLSTKERQLWVELQANTEEEIQAVALNSEVIKRYIDTQIPYFITARVLYNIKKGDIIVTGYTSTLLTVEKKTVIFPTSLYIANEDDFIYRIENDEAHIIYYIGEATRIVVPNRLEGYPVVSLEETSFNYSQVEYVKLPDTLISIN